MRTGDYTKEALFIGIQHNPELDELFWKLYNDDRINTDKMHTLINGKFDPHVTIGYLETGMHEHEEVKKNIGTKISRF